MKLAVIALLGLALTELPLPEWTQPGCSGARALAQTFLQNDFDGMYDHFRDVLPNKKSEDPTGGRIQGCPAQTMVVVRSFTIGACQADGSAATILVTFQRAGVVEKGEFRSQPEKMESVSLPLVFQKGQWWIARPRVPYVSPQALLQCYEDAPKDLPPGWWEKASAAQKAWMAKGERSMKALRSMSTK